MSRRILQIIPATGIAAAFREDGKECSYPVICWALVEDTEEDGTMFQWVVGMTIIDGQIFLDEIDGIESPNGFIRYEYAR